MTWIRRLLLLLLVPVACAALAVQTGQAAPDIELSGGVPPQKLSNLKGRVVYLDFWASWCGPCRESFPWMNDMQAKYGDRGLQIVGVNLDARRADADQFLAQTPARFELVFDGTGDSLRRFGVRGMPTSILVGADGKILFVHEGFQREDGADLEARLVAALNARRGTTSRD